MPTKTDVRSVRFNRETLAAIRSFGQRWGGLKTSPTIAVAFRILDHLDRTGDLEKTFLRSLLETPASDGDLKSRKK